MRIAARCVVAAALIAVPCCVVRAIMPQGADFVRKLPSGVVLRSGDVIFLGSATWRGRLLKIFDRDSVYVHTGILDSEDGVNYLVHADPCRDVVVREPLDAYLSSNKIERVMVMRVRNDGLDAMRAVGYAREKSGKHLRFNNTFRYGENDGFYCTELVLCAWQSAGVALLPNVQKGDRVFPSELLGSLRLKIIVECSGEELVYGDEKHIAYNGNANRSVQTNRVCGITWPKYSFVTRQASRREPL